MIYNQYSQLGPAEKLIYFEAASNSVLQQLILNEQEDIKTQILQLQIQEGETDTHFRRRFDKLKIKFDLLNEFLEINKQTQKDIQQLRGE